VSQALYRRYRPETFAEVIGQEHVTGPLTAALAKDRINHAYLFSGPRGCGKTTSARILARCLNCAQGPTPIPCGECDSCRDLARGGPGSLDVVEIDAASHGGVDDARSLRERAAFAPARDRYKVFIIDEAHMVSPQGFNALLKIVEEPPPHVRFVFATTEPDKVIGTIRSRTHHYPFRLVPPERLQSYLAELCEQEGVAVGQGVLPLVVRAGAGSVRDSLSVLDQLIGGAGPDGLSYALAVSLLGYTDSTLLDDVVDALAAGDGATVFGVVDRVIESGHDPRRFVEDLLERLRDLVVVAAVPDAGHAVLRALPSDQLDRMRGQAARFGRAELSRAADVVNAALTEMTGATSPRLQLELLCARLLLPAADDTERGLHARLDRLERRLGMAGPGAGGPGPVAQGPVAQGPVAQRAAGAPPGPSSAGSTASGAAGPTPERGAADGRPASRPDTAAPPTPNRPPASRPEQPPAPDRATPRDPRSAPDQPSAGGRRPAPDEHPTAGRRSAPAGAPGDSEPGVTPPSPGGPAGPGRAPTAGTVLDIATIRRMWPEAMSLLAGRKRTTWSLVNQYAQVLDYDGDRLLLGFDSEGRAGLFTRGPHGEVLRQVLIDALGLDCRFEAVGTDRPSSPEPSSGRAPAPPVRPGSGGPTSGTSGRPTSGGPTSGAASAAGAPAGGQGWPEPARPAQGRSATGPVVSAASGAAAGPGVAGQGPPAGQDGDTRPTGSAPVRPGTGGSDEGGSGAGASRAGRSGAGGSGASGSGAARGRQRPGAGRPSASPYADVPPPDEPPPDDEPPLDEPPPDAWGPTSQSRPTQPAPSPPAAAGPPAGPGATDRHEVDVRERALAAAGRARARTPSSPGGNGAPPPRLRPIDDEPSADDPDLEGSDLVGAPVVEQLLGGRLIEERED
jgi:DNA polymerase-3 subunit gamma/tau